MRPRSRLHQLGQGHRRFYHWAMPPFGPSTEKCSKLKITHSKYSGARKTLFSVFKYELPFAEVIGGQPLTEPE